MRSVLVKLKSGLFLEGPLWKWRPKLGAFSLAGEDGGQWLFLKDVESARLTRMDFVEQGYKEIDLVDHAKADNLEPWDGVTATTPKEDP